jgi:biopolymer transport protein ExbD
MTARTQMLINLAPGREAHFKWSDRLIQMLVRSAARRTTGAFADRLEEEWMADLLYRSGRFSRLRFALECHWAATIVDHDLSAAPVAGGFPPEQTLRFTGPPLRHVVAMKRRPSAQEACVTAFYEINTTPLIDVMLVMLVTLIISLPIMTHAVRMDLPRASPQTALPPSESIDIDVDADGTVAWNGSPVQDQSQLEAFLRAAATVTPQPELHIRADRHAKYGVVASVLAAAQRNRIEKMGFADTAKFRN